MAPITVVLVEDHALVRRAFRSLLEAQERIQVVAEGRTGLDALALARQYRPDVMLLDIAMPEMNGVDAALQIRASVPEVRIVMLTMYAEEPYIRQAIRAGVKGYVLKDGSEADLAQAVVTVARGQTFLSPGAASILAGVVEYGHEAAPDDPYQRLTARERQILQMIAQGHSNRAIADLLGISPKTVCIHRNNLMDTLRIRGTAKLTLYAVKKGLVKPS